MKFLWLSRFGSEIVVQRIHKKLIKDNHFFALSLAILGYLGSHESMINKYRHFPVDQLRL